MLVVVLVLVLVYGSSFPHGERREVEVERESLSLLGEDIGNGQEARLEDIVANKLREALAHRSTIHAEATVKEETRGHCDVYTPLFQKRLAGRVDDLCFGPGFVLALLTNGSLVSWGDGSSGALGHRTWNDEKHPRVIEALKYYHIRQIACGGGHVAVLDFTGNVYMWGENQRGQCGVGHRRNLNVPTLIHQLKDESIRMVTVALGGQHSAGIDMQGQLFTWGGGSYGQLGHRDREDKLEPTKVVDIMFLLKNVALGGFHTIATTADVPPQVWAFGRNDAGQLGVGDTTNYDRPVQVLWGPKEATATLGRTDVLGICAGCEHTVLVQKSYTIGLENGWEPTSVGTVSVWGNGFFGQLGIPLQRSGEPPSPEALAELKKDPMVRVESDLAGSLFGRMEAEEAGHEDLSPEMGKFNHFSPKIVGKLGNKKAAQVACGCHTTAVGIDEGQPTQLGEKDSNLVLYTFGSNQFGQLGRFHRISKEDAFEAMNDGTSKCLLPPPPSEKFRHGDDPVVLKMLKDARKGIRKLVGGFGNMGAITQDGDAYLWGFNEFHQVAHHQMKESFPAKPQPPSQNTKDTKEPPVLFLKCSADGAHCVVVAQGTLGDTEQSARRLIGSGGRGGDTSGSEGGVGGVGGAGGAGSNRVASDSPASPTDLAKAFPKGYKTYSWRMGEEGLEPKRPWVDPLHGWSPKDSKRKWKAEEQAQGLLRPVPSKVQEAALMAEADDVLSGGMPMGHGTTYLRCHANTRNGPWHCDVLSYQPLTH